MDVAERIKKIRIKNGLSQEQFAQIFHVTRQAVSNWENGRNYPELSSLAKMSIVFGVPLEDFIIDEQMPSK